MCNGKKTPSRNQDIKLKTSFVIRAILFALVIWPVGYFYLREELRDGTMLQFCLSFFGLCLLLGCWLSAAVGLYYSCREDGEVQEIKSNLEGEK